MTALKKKIKIWKPEVHSERHCSVLMKFHFWVLKSRRFSSLLQTGAVLCRCILGQMGLQTPFQQKGGSRVLSPQTRVKSCLPKQKSRGLWDLLSVEKKVHSLAVKPLNIYSVRWQTAAVAWRGWMTCLLEGGMNPSSGTLPRVPLTQPAFPHHCDLVRGMRCQQQETGQRVCVSGGGNKLVV